MPKTTMKSSSIKTIVVRLTAEDIFEIEVNCNIFDDPFMEAATRAVEKIKARKYGMIKPITIVWDKPTPDKTYLYNSYWILVNAACYKKAEILREKFKIQSDNDLAKEPYHARNISKPSK